MQEIRFTAARDIQAGEELTFYYGSNLWFQDVTADQGAAESTMHNHMDDESAFLSALRLAPD